MSNHNIKSGIYKITNTKNGKVYVGQSQDVFHRWEIHKSQLETDNHHNRHLQASWDKNGIESFRFIVVEFCPMKKLNEREIYWIEFYQSMTKGYNLTEGGHGCRGYKFTDEERVKMSLAQVGNKKWLGKKHSEKTKMKIAESNRRRVISDETRRRMSQAKLGKRASEESKKLMSKARKGHTYWKGNPYIGVPQRGKDNPMYGKRRGLSPNSKKIISDKVCFYCVQDCADFFGIGYSSMRAYLNGQRKMPEKLKEKNLTYLKTS